MPTGLVEAAARGDVAEVRRLLDDGADVDERDAQGRTAVTAAALGDHVEVARVLIAAGADVDLQDSDRNNALLVTGETGSVAMLRAAPRLTRTSCQYSTPQSDATRTRPLDTSTPSCTRRAT